MVRGRANPHRVPCGLQGTDINFSPITDSYKKVLPIFGAHPLSNVFNQAPVLLVEGEDDERIWQQAVRSSQWTDKSSVSVRSRWHYRIKRRSRSLRSAKILLSVYGDSAVGFSLRDRDLDPTEIKAIRVGPVKRMRLHCRAAENLLVSDEVLSKLNITE